MTITGTIIGYDPGGNGKHGVAFFTYNDSQLIAHKICTFTNANEVIEQSKKHENIIAIGIDTLTCWATGDSGWRPADRWLRNKYQNITNSITSPNSLYGSMCINGMSVLISMRKNNPNLIITETHPKVLYYALTNNPYDYKNNQTSMDSFLSKELKTQINTNDDHQWDAAISVYAAVNGVLGRWKRDLHQLAPLNNEKLILPCGDTNYWWPE